MKEEKEEKEPQEAAEREPEEAVPFDDTTEALRVRLAELSERVRLHLEGR
ncbi:hypothetical protein [Streptomyces johnsoniae]|uniref:Nucleotide exchange factor GrpE n=1 Tax=Streptomyces johnsoniae TaxID=3075532 RepID=A0ABU2S2C2_9ACTN|nr:hypothetical protein [Streptomyces sp. DSM 41886]MDT0441944.1 hypothetical protein [Streptomyces sp. DSM 41886]